MTFLTSSLVTLVSLSKKKKKKIMTLIKLKIVLFTIGLVNLKNINMSYNSVWLGFKGTGTFVRLTSLESHLVFFTGSEKPFTCRKLLLNVIINGIEGNKIMLWYNCPFLLFLNARPWELSGSARSSMSSLLCATGLPSFPLHFPFVFIKANQRAVLCVPEKPGIKFVCKGDSWSS